MGKCFKPLDIGNFNIGSYGNREQIQLDEGPFD